MSAWPGEVQPGVGVPYVPPAMRPYLSCAYWGIDRVVSVAEVAALPVILDKKEPIVTDAKEDLEHNLRLGLNGGPINFRQTLAPGESFDPNDHDPGTVIIFNQETLSRLEPHAPTVDLRAFKRQTGLPKPPTSLRLPVEYDGPQPPDPKQLTGGGLVYQVLVNCGVVVQPRARAPRQLMTFDGTGVLKPDSIEVFKLGLGKVHLSRTLSRPRLESVPLTVGESRAQNNIRTEVPHKKGKKRSPKESAKKVAEEVEKPNTQPRWIRINALGIVA